MNTPIKWTVNNPDYDWYSDTAQKAVIDYAEWSGGFTPEEGGYENVPRPVEESYRCCPPDWTFYSPCNQPITGGVIEEFLP